MKKKHDQMKQPTFASGVLFVLACCCAYGQPVPLPAPVQTVDKACEVHPVDPAFPPSPQMHGRCLAVKAYMGHPSPLSPIGDGTLSMMGDEAAFHLFSIMMERPPLTPVQTLTVLDIIHNSFKNPVFIQSHADRKPEKSLALLKIIQATAVDQLVKERIAAETTFLTTLPATITPVPILNLPSKPGVMPQAEDFGLGAPTPQGTATK
jgi:hypothetical protein